MALLVLAAETNYNFDLRNIAVQCCGKIISVLYCKVQLCSQQTEMKLLDVLEGKLMSGRRSLHCELQVQREQQKNLLTSRITEENKETEDARKELDRYMGALGSLSAKTATMKVMSDFTETDLSSLPDDVDWMEAVRDSAVVGDELTVNCLLLNVYC